MAKYLVRNWTFTPGAAGAGTIVIPGNIQLEQFLTIRNLTAKKWLFNFASDTFGASRSFSGGNTTLTLDTATTGQNASDRLQIIYDAPAAYQASATIQRDATTNPYNANDVIGGVITLNNMGPPGSSILINAVRLLLNITAVPSGMAGMLLYLFDQSPPSNILDNGTFSLAAGDRSSCLTPGGIPLGSPVLAPGGGSVVLEANNLARQIKMPDNNTALYSYLVTSGAFTPAANSETYSLIVPSMLII